MIRRLQLSDRPETPDLILGEDETHGLESAALRKGHLMATPIRYMDSIADVFTRVNNPDSIRSVGTSLAILIRDARLSKGWSQTELAFKADVSQRWVSDVERGVTEFPRDRRLRRVADVLGLPMADVYIAANLAQSRREAEAIDAKLASDVDSFAKRIYEKVEAVELEEWQFDILSGTIRPWEQASVRNKRRGRSQSLSRASRQSR